MRFPYLPEAPGGYVPLFLAPQAGVSESPFRRLCRRFGADVVGVTCRSGPKGLLAALAPVFDLHPFMLIVPAAIAASCAFMRPVATPHNAVVFGSGHVTIQQMIRAGFWLNLAGVVLITVLAYTVMMRMLGV